MVWCARFPRTRDEMRPVFTRNIVNEGVGVPAVGRQTSARLFLVEGDHRGTCAVDRRCCLLRILTHRGAIFYPLRYCVHAENNGSEQLTIAPFAPLCVLYLYTWVVRSILVVRFNVKTTEIEPTTRCSCIYLCRAMKRKGLRLHGYHCMVGLFILSLCQFWLNDSTWKPLKFTSQETVFVFISVGRWKERVFEKNKKYFSY